MKRLIFMKGKEPNFEKRINTYILDEQFKVVDMTMLEWNRLDRMYRVGLVVEEQMKFFRQNCLVLEQRDPDNLTKDLDDFSSVMGKAKNLEYEINFIRTYTLQTPHGFRYFAYVFYQD